MVIVVAAAAAAGLIIVIIITELQRGPLIVLAVRSRGTTGCLSFSLFSVHLDAMDTVSGMDQLCPSVWRETFAPMFKAVIIAVPGVNDSQ